MRASTVRMEGKDMTKNSAKAYEPACMPEQPGTCARCDMAYDCQSKMSGRLLPWPLVALAVVAVLAFVI